VAVVESAVTEIIFGACCCKQDTNKMQVDATGKFQYFIKLFCKIKHKALPIAA